MRTITLFGMAVVVAFTTISCDSKMKTNENPLLMKHETPYLTPPFHLIKNEHFKPAADSAMAIARAEIDEIISNTKEPDFANTIEALANAGKKLSDVSTILFNLNYAETNP